MQTVLLGVRSMAVRLPRLTALRVAWALLLVVTLWRFVDIASFDVRDGPLAGDQANFVLQAQSLRHGANLSFDSEDLRRWSEFGWADKPYGLFYRATDDGWVFAKPYGYSAYLVPFMAVLGEARGIAVANGMLLAALIAVVVALLRLRMTGPVVPLVATACVFASAAPFYGWVVHTEVFLAVLVGAACWLVIRHFDTGSYASGLSAVIVVAFAFSEKATLAFVFAPVLLLMLVKLGNWRRRVGVVAVGGAAVLVFVSPYLWYSDGQHWNPYQGERYYSFGEVPFDGVSSANDVRMKSADRNHYFSAEAFGRVGRAPEAIPQSALTTVVGRHTGLLVFAPMSLIALAYTVRRWRDADQVARLLLAGTVAYLLLYVLLLPRFYVGGSSFGNRYFVQISTATVAVLVLSPMRSATMIRAAVGSLMMSVVLLWPHHLAPRTTYSQRLHVTTPLQRLLPGETQLGNWETFSGQPGD